jgi:hypothetical protein
MPDLGAIPSDASTKGTWSAVYNWPVIPIHAVLLPDGRLLTFGTNTAGVATGLFVYDIWTPGQGTAKGHMTLPNGTGVDTFCSAMVVLPTESADVVMAGGDIWDGTATLQRGNNHSVTFSRASNGLSNGADMNRPRWYASMITLMNGALYVQGGRGSTEDGTDRPEVRNPDGSFKLLPNIDTTTWGWFYPRNWVAPDGRVFGFAPTSGHVYYIDPTGDGAAELFTKLPTANRGIDSSTAMFAPGKILQFGGASNGAVVIDINGGPPVVTPTQSMSTLRTWANATLLPDGKVLATGGSAERNKLVGVNLNAETWDPATGTWTIGSAGAVPRLYHSIAILMPDATVLVGGGGASGPLTNLNVETYYPPYLFTSDGKLAPRPTIVDAPAAIGTGQSVQVIFGNAHSISKVALVKTGAVTHSFNMDQRYVPLKFSTDGSNLTVQMPTRATDTPPGHYLLFLLDDRGVPSVGRIVRVL